MVFSNLLQKTLQCRCTLVVRGRKGAFIETTIEGKMLITDDMRLTKNTRRTRRETSLNAVFFIIYPFLYALGLNPVLCNKETANKFLSLETALVWICYISVRFSRLILFGRCIKLLLDTSIARTFPDFHRFSGDNDQ